MKKSKTIKKLQLEFNELMTPGAKCIAMGLSKNTSLELLNIKGNVIGDQGLILIAQALKESKMNLKELDISLNEIGPQGFQALCEVLPHTKITSLTCNKNFLGDDILALFTQMLPQTKLKKFDMSSCRLNDSGLLHLIEALQVDKQVSQVKLADNFFSEQIETLLLESLNKNTNLVELNFTGNRFSHSCLAKLKKITTRNIRMIEEQEPNKLKAEIYRLRYEHGKLEEAKTKLKAQKNEIENVKKLKSDL